MCGLSYRADDPSDLCFELRGQLFALRLTLALGTTRSPPSAVGRGEGIAERAQEAPLGRPVGDGEDDVGERPLEVGLQGVPED